MNVSSIASFQNGKKVIAILVKKKKKFKEYRSNFEFIAYVNVTVKTYLKAILSTVFCI